MLLMVQTTVVLLNDVRGLCLHAGLMSSTLLLNWLCFAAWCLLLNWPCYAAWCLLVNWLCYAAWWAVLLTNRLLLSRAA
jgi:hypothetical protein